MRYASPRTKTRGRSSNALASSVPYGAATVASLRQHPHAPRHGIAPTVLAFKCPSVWYTCTDDAPPRSQTRGRSPSGLASLIRNGVATKAIVREGTATTAAASSHTVLALKCHSDWPRESCKYRLKIARYSYQSSPDLLLP